MDWKLILSDIAVNFAAQFIFDGLKHLVSRKHPRSDFYVKALIDSLNSVARNLTSPVEANILRRKDLHQELLSSLQSPDLDRDAFLKIFKNAGLSEKSAERVFNEIYEKFKEFIEKEAVKNPDVFREIIAQDIKKIGVSTSQLVNDLQPLLDEWPTIIALLSEEKDRLTRIEREILLAREEIRELKNNSFTFSAISSSPFRYDLSELTMKLLQSSPISRKIADDDKEAIAETTKRFENWLQYSQLIYEMNPTRRRKLFSRIRNAEKKLGKSEKEIQLRLLLSLLIGNFPKIVTLSKKVNPKLDLGTRRLVFLSKQSLFVHAFAKGNIQTARKHLKEMKKLCLDDWKSEVLLFDTSLILSQNIPEKQLKETRKIISELKECARNKNQAYTAGILSGIFVFLGRTQEAGEILKEFEVFRYFSDFENFAKVTDLQTRGEIEKAKPILQDMVVSSKFQYIREMAQWDLIRLEAIENPVKAFKDLKAFMKDRKPRGELLARCLFLYSFILGRFGSPELAEKTLDKALGILEKPRLNFVTLTFRASMLLQKARVYLLPRRDFNGVSKIIKEVEDLPLLPLTKLDLLYLKAVKAHEERKNDVARQILRNLLKSCSTIRLKLKYLPHLIFLENETGRAAQAKKYLSGLLRRKDVSLHEKAFLNYLLGTVYHTLKKHARALRYYSEAEQLLFAQARASSLFQIEFGATVFNRFLFDMHSLRSIIAQDAMREMDFNTAWDLLKTFPAYFRHCLSRAVRKRSKEWCLAVAFEGMELRFTIMERYGNVFSALKEIEELLKLDFHDHYKAGLLLLKANFEAKLDIKSAEEDLKRATELSKGRMKGDIAKLNIKLQYLLGNLGEIKSIEDQIGDLTSTKQIAILRDLGHFFELEQVYFLSEACFRRGLRLIEKKEDFQHRRLLLDLAHMYASSDAHGKKGREEALKLLSELKHYSKGAHESRMIKLLRSRVLGRLGRVKAADKTIRSINPKELNEIELLLYYRIRSRLLAEMKAFEECISTINKALNLRSSGMYRSNLLFSKVHCALRLKNSLMARDILDNITFENLAEQEKKEYAVLYQKALLQENATKSAVDYFMKNLSAFSGKTLSFYVYESTRCYSDKELQLQTLRDGLKALRRQALDAVVATSCALLMHEMIEKINLMDVASAREHDLDLLFLYGWAAGWKDLKTGEALLRQCLEKGFKPMYLVHYALSVIYSAHNRLKRAVEHAVKAYENCQTDPIILIQYIGALIHSGRYDLAENFAKEVVSSPIFSILNEVRRLIMTTMVLKEQFKPAQIELENWVELHPLDLGAKTELAIVYILTGNVKRAVNLSNELIESDPENVVAKNIILYGSTSDKDKRELMKDQFKHAMKQAHMPKSIKPSKDEQDEEYPKQEKTERKRQVRKEERRRKKKGTRGGSPSSEVNEDA